MQTAKPQTANDTKVITGLVRFSYVHVWEPKAMEGSDRKKYSVSILIPKTDTAQIDRIKAAIGAAKENGKAKWGGKVPMGLKIPLRDGDTDRPDNEEYRGMYFLSASTDLKPGIINAAKQPIVDEDDFYSGCYGRASINFYGYNAAGNKGIACGLNNLMKIKDGERLSGGITAEQDFAEVDNSSLLGDDEEVAELF
jgi:hypothetical protein